MGHSSESLFAAWSPDGQRLAFESQQDENVDIYVINVDGSGLKRLTFGKANDRFPTWSSDREWIAFVSGETQTDIYVVHPDGKGMKNLTSQPTGQQRTPRQADEQQPSWSPDSQLIAFVSGDVYSDLEIYTIRPDGSDKQVAIPHPHGFDQTPVWSPDGRRFAFWSETGNRLFDLYMVDATPGSNPVRLTNHEAVIATQPIWSPDGERIAYSAPGEGDWDIYVVNISGSGPKRLTTDPAEDRSPTWSPDGRRIAFASNRDGAVQIYTMKADGSEQVRLTNTPAGAVNPVWQP